MITTTITNHSDNLTKLDLFNIKNYSNGTVLDKVIADNGGDLVVSYPQAWATVHSENDQPKKGNSDKYDKLVFIADGVMYHTGSETFMRNFFEIIETFDDSDGMAIRCFSKPSKNYTDKNFLCCMPVERGSVNA